MQQETVITGLVVPHSKIKEWPFLASSQTMLLGRRRFILSFIPLQHYITSLVSRRPPLCATDQLARYYLPTHAQHFPPELDSLRNQEATHALRSWRVAYGILPLHHAFSIAIILSFFYFFDPYRIASPEKKYRKTITQQPPLPPLHDYLNATVRAIIVNTQLFHLYF
jgi:hypothetical protein